MFITRAFAVKNNNYVYYKDQEGLEYWHSFLIVPEDKSIVDGKTMPDKFAITNHPKGMTNIIIFYNYWQVPMEKLQGMEERQSFWMVCYFLVVFHCLFIK